MIDINLKTCIYDHSCMRKQNPPSDFAQDSYLMTYEEVPKYRPIFPISTSIQSTNPKVCIIIEIHKTTYSPGVAGRQLPKKYPFQTATNFLDLPLKYVLIGSQVGETSSYGSTRVAIVVDGQYGLYRQILKFLILLIYPLNSLYIRNIIEKFFFEKILEKILGV